MAGVFQHPLTLIVLALSLVGTPISYRGGASDAHAHMFVEFMLDAANGSFGHHHGSAQTESDADGHDHGHDHASDVADAEERTPTGQEAVVADAFGPSFSAFVIGDVGQLASVLPLRDPPPIVRSAFAVSPFGSFPTGLTSAPAAPPPR